MGHIPREISLLCNHFLNCGGALESRIRDNKYGGWPVPKGGLEIPIFLIVKEDKAVLSGM